MKRYILLSVLFLSVAITNIKAQSSINHLTFKNIPITGSLSNMINKLQASGYELKDSDDSSALFEGKFANEDCYIIVYTTKKSKLVYHVAIVFEGSNSWTLLKSDYTRLKKQLREKYNIKPNSTETFLSPYYEGDGYELQALKLSKCFYNSRFRLDNGTITLLISKEGVLLSYIDSYNESINEKEENDSAFDDL